MKGTIVNRALPSLHGGALETTLTVSLPGGEGHIFKIKNRFFSKMNFKKMSTVFSKNRAVCRTFLLELFFSDIDIALIYTILPFCAFIAPPIVGFFGDKIGNYIR